VAAITVNANHKHEVPFSSSFPLVVSSIRFTPQSGVPENYHDYLEVSRIDGGNGTLRLGDETFPIARGDVILMGPDVLHTVEVNDPGRLQITSLWFLPQIVYTPGEPEINFDWLRPFYDRATLRHPVVEADRTDSVVQAFHALVRKQNEDSPYRHLELRICLLQLLLELVRRCDIPSEDHALDNRRQDRITRVVRWMNESFQERLTLDQAAGVACMSPQHFCRFFKSSTGHTFTEYLSRIRVAYAKQMLLNGRFRVTDIAYEVGFGSQSYFYRVFREVTGVSPTEYVAREGRMREMDQF
jgi:AraC-like DNA-binding protein